MSISEAFVDNRNVRIPFPASTANQIGDLLWWDTTNLVGRQASTRADLGSLANNQRDLVLNFLGVAGDNRVLAETSTGHASLRMVIVDGIFNCTCASQAFEIGGGGSLGTLLVGVDRNPTTPGNYNQQINKAAGNNPACAIGFCVRRTEGLNVTQALCRITSRLFWDIPMMAAIALEQQGVGATILADGAVTIDPSFTPLLSMTPTVNRIIALPLNSVAPGLVYTFTNNAASAINVTFTTNSGGTIKGNGVVPQSKTGYFWYDIAQASWVGLVSA